jgi:hypothetical protein
MSKPILKSTELANTVAQHNTLVNARFHMEEIETKIFISGLRRIRKNDSEFSVFEIHKSEILPQVTGGKSYELIKDAVFRLADRIIKIENDRDKKRKLIAIPLISLCEYEEGTGLIKLLFNNSVRPYLLSLQGNFTSAEIKYLFKLKKHAAHRLYWLLKSNFYGNTTEFEKDVDEIKEILGIEGKYPNFFDFDKRILKPAWEEIQNTDIKYNYKPLKSGKAVKKIIFIKLESFNPEENPGPPLPGIVLSPELEKELRQIGITSIDVIARMIYENKINEGYIRYCITLKRGKTANLAGAIYKDITEKYKWEAYQKKINPVKKTIKVEPLPKEKISLIDAKDAFETVSKKKMNPYDTWEEMLEKGYIQKGFKLINENGVEYLIKN